MATTPQTVCNSLCSTRMLSSAARRFGPLLLTSLFVVEGVVVFANTSVTAAAQDYGFWALITRVTSMRESASLIILGMVLVLTASHLRRRRAGRATTSN